MNDKMPSVPFGSELEKYPLPPEAAGDFAVRVTGDELEPWLHDGDILLAERRIDLADGDVGLFHIRGTLVWRQYCRDSFGNIHLLVLNRAKSGEDVCIPASSDQRVTCYARALLRERISLPMD